MNAAYSRFTTYCMTLAIALTLAGCGGVGGNSTSSSAVTVSLNQSSANIAVSSATQFTATVQNASNTAVTWSVNGVVNGNSKVGTISNTGLYTAPAVPGSFTVTATSVADSAASAKAAIAVGMLGALTPATAMLTTGATQQFSTTVQGFSNTSVNWSVDKVAGGNATVGTISPSGLYTAPAQAGNHTVTATSVADASLSASATVVVSNLSAAVSPTAVTLIGSATQQFAATVVGESNQSVTWSATGGTIPANGTFTAPAQAGSFTVTATSVADPSLTASATVTVFTIGISPASSTLALNASQQFSATVLGLTSPLLAWSVDQINGGNPSVGTISSTGLYTAPAAAGTHTISASVANTSGSATAPITVINFTISPTVATVDPSSTQQFSAAIQGQTNPTFAWSVDGVLNGNASVGTISSSGLYTAPATVGPHTITASTTTTPTVNVSAALTVINNSPGAVLTYHNDDARDGAFTQELTLTPSNVNATQFGKLYAYPVDGQIYAQPLYVPQLSIGGTLHDVVFVATMNNSVYAFDADATSSQTAQTLWHAALGSAVSVCDTGGPCPQVGILSTPVIDTTTNTLYLVAEQSPNNPTPFRLYGLDVTTGAVKLGPVVINATYSGDTIETSCYQRMSLALSPVTNWIYIPFGSCTHGWIVAYDKATLTQQAVFEDTNGAAGGGFWAGGGAPAIDDASGNVYLMSGTDYDDQWISPPPAYTQTGYNDSFLNLNSTTLDVQSYFTPSNNYFLSEYDVDLGSGAPTLVPGNSQYPHALIGGGKDGNVYVVNPLNMGNFNGTDNVIQTVTICSDGNNNIFSTPVYWNGTIYYHCNDNVIAAYSWNASTAQMSTAPTSSGAAVFQMHGATPSLSSNGATNGIIWDIDNSAYTSCGCNPSQSGPSVLHAYDASNVASELYNSSQAANGRDTAGLALKFTVPTIAGGRVFVPTSTELDIYGLLP